MPRHPLLASLARDVGELQERLTGIADRDLHHDIDGAESMSLLHCRRAAR